MNQRRSTTAFTLVELLVVIGIIALLISILLPALSKARRAGNTVKCLANQKQLITATLMYANENRGILPFTSFYDPPKPNWLFDMGIPIKGQQNEVMNGQIWPFLGHVGVYHCPEDNGPWRAGSVNNLSSYCMNGAISAYDNVNNNCGLRVVKFHPDDVVYWEFCMTKAGSNGANDATNLPPEGVTARHKHGTTVSHIDGHADVMMSEEFNTFCQTGPTVLWADPTVPDGGIGKGRTLMGSIPNPVPIQE